MKQTRMNLFPVSGWNEAWAATALLCLLSDSFGCSRSAPISGGLYVRLRNGDVRKGADVGVSLVPVTTTFMREWKQLEGEFLPALKKAEEICDQESGGRGLTKFFCSKLIEVQTASDKQAKDLMSRNQTAAVRTDINGH